MAEAVIGRLSAALKTGGPVLGGWVGVNDAMVAETLAGEAFDTVVIDLQHGAVDFAGALRCIPAIAAAGKPAIARVPVGDFATASRLIDAGAAGIIAPMIDSAAEARRFVEFMKYTPLGERSWGPRAALTLSGLDAPAYLSAANGLTQAMAMIETREALDALDDILSVDGVDGVYVGPNDLSIALALGAAAAPRGEAIMRELPRVIDRAAAHGKYAGVFCYDGADARAMLALGFRFCTVSSDTALLRSAARAELSAARAKA